MKLNDELKTSLECAFLLFCVTCPLILLKSTRDALYLSGFSTRSLPYLMGVNTVITAIVAAGYLRLYKTLSLRGSIAISFLVYLVGTLFFWQWTSSQLKSATLPLYIWAGIFGTLAPVQAWSVVSSRLLVRQARRSLGFIGSGAIVGGIVGGFLAKFLAKIWKVQTLLPFAAIFILLALITSYLLCGPVEVESESESAPVDQKSVVRKKFIVLLMIVVGALTIVSTFADFQFKVISQHKIQTAQSLAIFFGTFYGYLGILTLAFQLFATPALMRRLGLSLTLSVLPAALFIGNGFLLIIQSLWAVVFLKGSEQLFRFSLDRSSMEVIYLAIPQRERVRIKSLIDTVGVRLFEALGSGLLILLFTLAKFPLNVITVLSIVMCSTAIGAILLLDDEYAARLKSSVSKREFPGAILQTEAFSTSFHNLLPQIIKRSTKEMILNLLELLESDKRITRYLKSLIEHPDAEVRLRTLQMLSKREDDFSQKVENLLFDPDARVRQEAIHYVLIHAPMGYLDQIVKLTDDPNAAVRIAANAAALNAENAEVRKEAYEKLKMLPGQTADVSAVEIRLEMANALGFIRPSPTSEELFKRLLMDSSQEVQRAALQSIGRSRPSGLISTLVDVDPGSPLLQEYQETLASYGPTLLPQLRKLMNDKKKSRDQKKLIIKIADMVGGPLASEMLSETAHGPDLVLRFASIKGMNRLKKNDALAISEEEIESLLEQELEALKVEIQRVRFIGPPPNTLIDQVLRQREKWTMERIFRVLGLLYDSRTIYQAYLALDGDDRSRRESALELLDTLLKSDHRQEILSLIETPEEYMPSESSPDSRKSMLMGYLGARDELPAAALIAALTEDQLQSWDAQIRETLKVFTGLSLVEETLGWRFSQMTESQDVDKKSKSLAALRKMESLGKIDIFGKMGPHELLALARGSSEVTFQPEEIIFAEGDEPLHIYMLLAGRVERNRSSGRIDEIHPGESFGALAALTRKPHLYSARALELSHCLKLEREILLDVLEDFPALSLGIFESLAQRIQSLMDKVEQLEKKETPKRQ